jgi:hypothetical protein
VPEHTHAVVKHNIETSVSFAKATGTFSHYLNILENFVHSSINCDMPCCSRKMAQDSTGALLSVCLSTSICQTSGLVSCNSWPATSLDISEGHVKYYVYQISLTYTNDLKNRIQSTIATLDIRILHCAWIELEYHLELTCVTWCPCSNCIVSKTNLTIWKYVLWLFIQFSFTRRVVKIIYIYPTQH